MSYPLRLLPGRYVVCRVSADAPRPAFPVGDFVSVTRTADEWSIVCREEVAPAEARQECGWRCLGVQGPLDFTLVGVLASLVGPLAEASISVFVLSTFDTDYLLVKEADLTRAVEALRAAGHSIE